MPLLLLVSCWGIRCSKSTPSLTSNLSAVQASGVFPAVLRAALRYGASVKTRHPNLMQLTAYIPCESCPEHPWTIKPGSCGLKVPNRFKMPSWLALVVARKFQHENLQRLFCCLYRNCNRILSSNQTKPICISSWFFKKPKNHTNPFLSPEVLMGCADGNLGWYPDWS